MSLSRSICSSEALLDATLLKSSSESIRVDAGVCGATTFKLGRLTSEAVDVSVDSSTAVRTVLSLEAFFESSSRPVLIDEVDVFRDKLVGCFI